MHAEVGMVFTQGEAKGVHARRRLVVERARAAGEPGAPRRYRLRMPSTSKWTSLQPFQLKVSLPMLSMRRPTKALL